MRQVSGPSLPALMMAIAMDKLLEVGDAKMTEVTNYFVTSEPKTCNVDATRAVTAWDSDQDCVGDWSVLPAGKNGFCLCLWFHDTQKSRISPR